MATKSKNEVTTSNTQVAAIDAEVPAFLLARQNEQARGSENVGAEDLVIPRLELIQALSPCLIESESGYIDGSKPGQLFNNVTRELFGNEVQVIPVFFKKEFIVWKARKLGGGFVGAFATADAAEAARQAQEKPDDHQVNDTANFFCLKVDAAGKMSEIVVSMAITKLKIARTWNSLIRLAGGDSFSRIYTIGTALEKNKQDQPYFNFSVKTGPFVNADQFDRAEKLYEAVKSGLAVADRTGESDAGSDGQTAPSNTEY